MIAIRKDGGWAWCILLSVICCQTILGGVIFSSGIFYVIFKEALNSDPVVISWLCSLPMTMWYFACPFGSVITNRFGCRKCAFIGGIMAAAGLILGFFAESIEYLFFTHGLLTGFGLGLNYIACMAVMNIYFDKYKTIATGIASTGHNIGLIVYTQLMNNLQENYSWRGMLFILGALSFNLCACSTAMFPLTSGKVSMIKEVKEIKSNTVKKKENVNLSLFRKLSFVSFCSSNIFTNLSLGIFILHLPSYSKEVGFTEQTFGTVLMVFGVTTFVGKVVYSLLGQHPRMDETTLYTFSLTATGVCIFLIPVLLTETGMLTLSGLVGFFYSVTGALLQAVIFKIVGYDRFADGVGLSLPFKAAGNLIGGPLAGVLLTITGKYTFSFYLSGICMTVASFLMFLPLLSHRRRDRREKNKNFNTVYEMNISNDKEQANGLNNTSGTLKPTFKPSLGDKECDKMLLECEKSDICR